MFDNSFSEDILINAFVSFQSEEQNNSASTKIGWSVKAVVVFEDGYAYTWVTSAYAPNRSRLIGACQTLRGIRPKETD